MAWLYVPGSADSNSVSGECGPSCEPSVGSSGTGSPLLSSQAAWPMTWKDLAPKGQAKKPWLRPLFGMISRPLMASRGVESWISSLRATRASRSALPGSSSESETNGTSGPRLPASFAKWYPDGLCWRTSEIMFDWGSTEFSGTWPTSGTIRSGVAFERRMSARRTSGSGSSFWPTARSRDEKGISQNCDAEPGKWTLADATEHWQTPATDSFRSRGGERADEPGLDRQAKWATPREIYGQGHAGMEDDSHTTWQAIGLSRGLLAPETETPGSASLEPIPRSPLRLNAVFVEWLMGFPRGWSRPYVGTD